MAFLLTFLNNLHFTQRFLSCDIECALSKIFLCVFQDDSKNIFTALSTFNIKFNYHLKKNRLLLFCYQSYQKKNIVVILYTLYTLYTRVAKTSNDNVRRFYFMIFCFVIVVLHKSIKQKEKPPTTNMYKKHHEVISTQDHIMLLWW